MGSVSDQVSRHLAVDMLRAVRVTKCSGHGVQDDGSHTRIDPRRRVVIKIEGRRVGQLQRLDSLSQYSPRVPGDPGGPLGQGYTGSCRRLPPGVRPLAELRQGRRAIDAFPTIQGR
jgi:hypothetical protein